MDLTLVKTLYALRTCWHTNTELEVISLPNFGIPHKKSCAELNALNKYIN